jgi:hypothetical protein
MEGREKVHGFFWGIIQLCWKSTVDFANHTRKIGKQIVLTRTGSALVNECVDVFAVTQACPIQTCYFVLRHDNRNVLKNEQLAHLLTVLCFSRDIASL